MDESLVTDLFRRHLLSMAWAGLTILRPGWLSTAESRKAARRFVKEEAVKVK